MKGNIHYFSIEYKNIAIKKFHQLSRLDFDKNKRAEQYFFENDQYGKTQNKKGGFPQTLAAIK